MRYIIILLYLSAISLYSSISVSGDIAVNTTWDTDTVYVSGNLNILNGVKLTVEAGTIVYFQENYKIDVNGSLVSNGALADSVYFTALSTGPGWKKIYFNNIDAANDSSLIEYTSFKFSNERAVYVNNSDKIRISNSLFSKNNGGAMLLYDSDIEMYNVDFTYNQSINKGGGLSVYNSSPKLYDCLFYFNQSNGGAAISTYNSDMEVYNSIISNNSSTGNGAISMESSNYPAFRNCLIVNNQSVNGGGVHQSDSFSRFYNCTISRNKATGSGNGLYFENGSDSYLINSIVFYNNNENQVYLADIASDISVSYSDVEGGSNGILRSSGLFNGLFYSSYSEIPGFVSKSAGSGSSYNGLSANWSLLSGSTLLNKGTIESDSLNLLTYDLNGNDRIYSSVRVDIGAYEILGNPPVIQSMVTQNVNENSNLSFSILVDDPESDDIHFSIIGGVESGMELDSLSGDFSWTPTFAQNGTYNVSFLAIEQTAHSYRDTLDLEIIVNDVDQNISINNIQPSLGGYYSVISGNSINFSIDAVDPDGNSLIYQWIVDFNQVSLTNNYMFTGSEGSYNVTLNLSDGQGKNYQTINWKIAVLPSDFQYNNTEFSHDITIPDDEILLNGVEVDEGDYFGVFYLDGTILSCAGYGEYRTDMNKVITVFGDDPMTGEKEGFTAGEEFIWQIWKKSDKSLKICAPIYSALGGGITGSYYFANGALSEVTDFYSDYQSISLPDHWDIFSLNTDPIYRNISSVFKLINDDVILVKDKNGSIYAPEYGINNIGDLILTDGYKVKLANPRELEITGLKIDTSLNSVNVVASTWSYIGYSYNEVASISAIVDGSLSPGQGDLTSDVVIIKSGDGRVFMPGNGINQIGNLEPGNGYQIYTSSDIEIIYPESTKDTVVEKKSWRKTENYIPVKPTGNDMVLIFSDEVLKSFEGRGELGVFCDDHCYGASVFEGENFAVTVFGDDISTMMKDGLVNDDKLQVKYYDIENGCETTLVLFTKDDEIMYRDNTIIMVDRIIIGSSVEVNLPTKNSLSQNYPNPFNPSTTIPFSLSKDSNVSLKVYNSSGEFVEEIANGFFHEGKNSIDWKPTTGISSGVYIIVMNTGSDNFIRKITLVR
ncbi:MAG: right-handed parallel beta-helix repeat-containing protein [Candidatus Delongbacteria bacterium]|nr:right-handed parallel beta-helix repeat-containing protein [Candidatus Delongbacteria bacterium]MBN2834507.1 right-handed parallel beta-helix repeat-containing protein [Candidatus Delongbacteria bacterium]